VERARSHIGTTLRGKWVLETLLGVGGMAAVYAATHRNGSRAAVKLLHRELTTDAEARARFLREGYAANAVGHEGAVRVIDDDVAEDGSLFLVTELLEGETLDDRRQRQGGRLAEDEVLGAIDQVLDVLASAHDKGIVHRDLKPENIFLTRAGRVKVLDFGIARLKQAQAASLTTQSGATMGTPAFMSPEQARGLWEEVDASSDIWAVGATMFSLLTGRSVHEGRTVNEVLLAAMTAVAPLLGSVAPHVSPATAHVVDGALSYDKKARWPNARAMQGALQRAYEARSGKPLAAAPPLEVPSTGGGGSRPAAVQLLAQAPVHGPLHPTTSRPVVTRGGPPSSSLAQPTLDAPPRAHDRRSAFRFWVVAGIAGGLAVIGVGAAGVVHIVRSGQGAAPSAESAKVADRSAAASPTPATLGSAGGTSAGPTDGRVRTQTPTSAGAMSAAASAVLQPLVGAPVDSAPPEGASLKAPSVAATTPPFAATAAAAAVPTWPKAPPKTPVAHTSGAAAREGCTPPYVVDPVTRKKMWKEECL
jgi:serine/threonine-protein kinase